GSGEPSIDAISLLKTQRCPDRRRRSWFLARTMRAIPCSGAAGWGSRLRLHLGREPEIADHLVHELGGKEVGARLSGNRAQLHDVAADDLTSLAHGQKEAKPL